MTQVKALKLFRRAQSTSNLELSIISEKVKAQEKYIAYNPFLPVLCFVFA